MNTAARVIVWLTASAVMVGAIWTTPFTNIGEVLLGVVGAYSLLALLGLLVAKPESRRELGRNLLLISASLLLMLVLAEVAGFIIIDYRRAFATPSGESVPLPDGWQVYDEQLLVRGKQGVTRSIRSPKGELGTLLCLAGTPFRSEVKYDRNGFRNSADLARANIVVLGDSFVEARIVPESLTFTTRLSRVLGVKVANLGQTWYGPQQELEVLRRYALTLHPATIVWVFYEGNDLGDLADYPELVKKWRRYQSSLALVWNRSFTANFLFLLLSFTDPQPHTPVIKGHGLRAGFRPCPVWLRGDLDSQALVPNGQGRVTTYFLAGTPVLDELSRARLQAVFADAHRLAAAAGARLVVAFAPTKYRVYHGWAEFPRRVRFLVSWGPPSNLPAELQVLLLEVSSKVGFIDLTPALRSASQRGILAFPPDDEHWSAAGHEVVAAVLAEYLQKRP